jgi:hypothetical protein
MEDARPCAPEAPMNGAFRLVPSGLSPPVDGFDSHTPPPYDFTNLSLITRQSAGLLLSPQQLPIASAVDDLLLI